MRLKMITPFRTIGRVNRLKITDVSGTSDPVDISRDGPRNVGNFQSTDTADSIRRFYQDKNI
jgi:hypothetical protein